MINECILETPPFQETMVLRNTGFDAGFVIFLFSARLLFHFVKRFCRVDFSETSISLLRLQKPANSSKPANETIVSAHEDFLSFQLCSTIAMPGLEDKGLSTIAINCRPPIA